MRVVPAPLLYAAVALLVAGAVQVSPVNVGIQQRQGRAAALQKEVDAAIVSGKPATIDLCGTYNFSKASLLIAGARHLTLQPAPGCAGDPELFFSVWPCGELLGGALVCRPVNFSDPQQPSRCRHATGGAACACPDVVWSSGINISNSVDVTVRGLVVDYSPRALPPAACKPGPVPAPWPVPGSATAQFNSGRKFTYLLFNSSRVVTEDLVIRSAPFMAITSFLGDGAHIFRRVRFEPDPNDFGAMVAAKDGLHESDVRTGLQFVDSTIHGTADDFFNLHNTLQIVYRCDATTSSCLVVCPHINAVPLNTIYGSQRVLGTVRAGDVFSFYPLSHNRHPENNTPPVLTSATVKGTEQVTDGEVLQQV